MAKDLYDGLGFNPEKKPMSKGLRVLITLLVLIGVGLLVVLSTGCVAMKGIGAIAGMKDGETNKINGVVEVVRADASRPVLVYSGYPGYGGGSYYSYGTTYGPVSPYHSR